MGRKHQEEHFKEFEPHTVLKHGVLDRYATAWTQILKQKHGKLWIVDGFAGKGKDDAGNPGSPLLLAETADRLSGGPVEVRLIAVEPRRDWYADLKQNLAAFDAEAGGSRPVAYLRRGELAPLADDIFALIGDAPAFFFLDPFGADGLALSVVRRALAVPKGEVFALFSRDGVYRNLSVLAADRTGDTKRAYTQRPSLFPDLDAEWLAADVAEAERADAGLRPNKDAAERILGELFGSADAVRAILDLPRKLWVQEALSAYLNILKGCGATHRTAIAVMDEKQRCTYYLIHAAKSSQACFKMKEAVSSAISKSGLSGKTKHSLRLAHSARIGEVVAAVRARFAGQDVLWSEKGLSGECVRGFALRETTMFSSQAEELQTALQSYEIEQRPRRYRFPVTP